MKPRARKELVEVIGQLIVSLVAIAASGFVIWRLPENREWAFGVIGIVLGYWLR